MIIDIYVRDKEEAELFFRLIKDKERSAKDYVEAISYSASIRYDTSRKEFIGYGYYTWSASNFAYFLQYLNDDNAFRKMVLK